MIVGGSEQSDPPRIIHQMWVQGLPIPDHIALMMGTWKWFHPRWEYQFWHAGNIPDLANQELWDRAAEISPEAPEQFQSDVARYEILLNFGGVWVDADFECQKPIDELNHGVFAGREGKWLNNALIGAPVGHPLLFDLVAKLPANVAKHGPEMANTKKSGPQFFTPIARRFGITEYPQRYFYPYLWNQLEKRTEDFPESWAIHRWNHRMTMKGLV